MRRVAILAVLVAASLPPTSGLAAPPEALDDDGFATAEAVALSVAAVDGVLANDTGAAAASLESPPTHGMVDLRPDGSFTYTPPPGFRGVDSFTYRAVGPSARDVVLQVDRARSSAQVVASLATDFGNRSDDDTSSITGTVTLRLDPGRAPFDSVRITDFEFTAADGADLRFDYGGLAGRVDVSVPAESLQVTLEVPGPAATADPDGTFTQTENAVRAQGTADISATRGLSLIIDDTSETIDSTQIVDIADARLAESGGGLEFTLPLDFVAEVPAAEGIAVDVALEGSVVATGPRPAPTEVSAPATVSIQVGDPGPVDTDGDGMDDRYEEDFGLVVGIDDSAEDPDGDRATNLEESIAGTDPRDARSRLATASIGLDGDGLVVLTIAAVPGRTYTAEWSTPGSPGWTPFANPEATATAGEGAATVTLAFAPPATPSTTVLLRARTTVP